MVDWKKVSAVAAYKSLFSLSVGCSNIDFPHVFQNCKLIDLKRTLISGLWIANKSAHTVHILWTFFAVLHSCSCDNCNINPSKHAALLIKISDLFCTLSLKFPSGISPFHVISFSHILLQLFHTTQPLKCQGSRVKHMQHGLQFITPHLPDNFSLLTSLGKSYSLLYNVWGLG